MIQQLSNLSYSLISAYLFTAKWECTSQITKREKRQLNTSCVARQLILLVATSCFCVAIQRCSHTQLTCSWAQDFCGQLKFVEVLATGWVACYCMGCMLLYGLHATVKAACYWMGCMLAIGWVACYWMGCMLLDGLHATGWAASGNWHES